MLSRGNGALPCPTNDLGEQSNPIAVFKRLVALVCTKHPNACQDLILFLDRSMMSVLSRDWMRTGSDLLRVVLLVIYWLDAKSACGSSRLQTLFLSLSNSQLPAAQSLAYLTLIKVSAYISRLLLTLEAQMSQMLCKISHRVKKSSSTAAGIYCTFKQVRDLIEAVQ